MKIPDSKAIILWNETGVGGGAVSDVFVADIGQQPSWAASIDNSAGACADDWLRGPWHATPLGVFASLALMGFSNSAERLQALREFSKIEGQEWPLDMLRALGETVEDESHG